MPLVQTRGAASAQGFGEFAQATSVNYIEDVFSTFLYSGTGASQTITNNIDLSTKGGLVWIKERTSTSNNILTDTLRGVYNYLISNTTSEQQYNTDTLTAFNANGFSVGPSGATSESGQTYVSWTFRKQPKFFDVLTYTGTGSVQTIAHSLGSAPGCIIVKTLSVPGNDWGVYHRGLGATYKLNLNATTAAALSTGYWNNTEPTSTQFTVATSGITNQAGETYVAYLFAHDSGGFGLTGADNVISCGSFTTVSSGYSPNVELGYEPQWIMLKRTDSTGDWLIVDTMRGWVDPSGTGANDANLRPNLSDAENTNDIGWPYATGFNAGYRGGAESTWIYIAIRRGPMKVPTLGTSVFGMSARSGTGADATVTGGQTDDAVIIKNRGSAVGSLFSSRLTNTGYLVTSSTAAEVAAGTTILQANPWDVMDGVKVGSTSTITNASANTYINYLFKRAPNFFDVVCYAGNDTIRTLNHNLGVTPELMIVRGRNITPANTNGWTVYAAPLGNTKYFYLNTTNAAGTFTGYWNDTTPTASVFTLGVGNAEDTNATGKNFVAYLFATLAGVSKVGSYTGNGSTQTVDCGFGAGGARFVLIKRTDSTGDWYVYDTARGMTVLTDPYWLTNSAAAEAATLGSVTTVSTGFAVNESILAGINTNAATYIFLAIA